jgi:CDP-diacylglycerol--glycerol-3-phosphate 3-phosphatidyltransferase
MKTSDFFLLPNLLSLTRIALTPLVGYFLAKSDDLSVVLCVGVLVIAVATDALDGWTARKLNLQSQLGLYLDPIADKLFAAVLLVLLVIYRDVPIWLMLVVVGRDLAILLAGTVVLKKKGVLLSSNLTGQYAFFSIVILLGFYVIRFEFGQLLAMTATIILTAASTFNYGKRFFQVVSGRPVSVFRDRKLYQGLRIGLTALLLAVCLVMYLKQILG